MNEDLKTLAGVAAWLRDRFKRSGDKDLNAYDAAATCEQAQAEIARLTAERDAPQVGTDAELAQRLRNFAHDIDGDGVSLRELQPHLFAAARCIVRLSRREARLRKALETARNYAATQAHSTPRWRGRSEGDMNAPDWPVDRDETLERYDEAMVRHLRARVRGLEAVLAAVILGEASRQVWVSEAALALAPDYRVVSGPDNPQTGQRSYRVERK